MKLNRRRFMGVSGASVLSALVGSNSVGCAIRHVATSSRMRTIEDVVESIDWASVPSEDEVRASLPVVFEYLTGRNIGDHINGFHFNRESVRDELGSDTLAYFSHGTQEVTFNMFNFVGELDGLDFWSTTFHESGHSISVKVDEEMTNIYEACGAVSEGEKSLAMAALGLVSGLTDKQKKELSVRNYVTSTLSELEAISFNLASIVKMGNVSGFPMEEYLRERTTFYFESLGSDNWQLGQIASLGLSGSDNLPNIFSKYTFSNYFLLVLSGDFDYDLELTYNYIRDASNEDLIKDAIRVGDGSSVYKLHSAIEGIAGRYGVVIDSDLPEIDNDVLRREMVPVVKLLRKYSQGISGGIPDVWSVVDEMKRGRFKFEPGMGYDPETVLDDEDFLSYVAAMYGGLVEHMPENMEIDDDYYLGMENTLGDFIENNPDNKFLFAAYRDLMIWNIAQHDWQGVVEKVDEFVEGNSDNPYCITFLDMKMEILAEVLQDYEGAWSAGADLSILVRERGREWGYDAAHNSNVTLYSFVLPQREGEHEYAVENLRAYVDSINESIETNPILGSFSDRVYFLSEASLYLARSLEEIGENEEAREIYQGLLSHVGGIDGRRGSHLIKEYMDDTNDPEIINRLYMKRNSGLDFIDVLPIAKFAEWRLSLL